MAGDVVEDQADEQPAPLVTGAISRSVVDAAAAYSSTLARLWSRPLDCAVTAQSVAHVADEALTAVNPPG